MFIQWDTAVQMTDGSELRADVFRPETEGQHPVILSYGPYAKGLSFQEGYPDAWNTLISRYPSLATETSNNFQAWEVVDPERWVPAGYACVRVDARGWGRSPGYIDPWSPQEAQDIYECIEWAAQQPWCSGKVGMLGISYYAINQWHVAALHPPHLAAIIPWEGFGDFYRDMNYHGGIASDMKDVWYERTTTTVQHGLGYRGGKNEITGELVAGPETLSNKRLHLNRTDFPNEIRGHPLDDEYHAARSADWDQIDIPFLTAGNWGGCSLHLRGSTEAFSRAASTRKWMEIHGLEHWTEFYGDYGYRLQRRFLDHFLKGIDNGWDTQPPVMLRVRTVDGGFRDRTEDAWPIPRTEWTRRYLDPATSSLSTEPLGTGSEASFRGLDDPGVTMLTEPLSVETEVTGPVAARVFIRSSTADADIFAVLRVFDPDGDEIVFPGAVDPNTPVGQGWLRASHRRLDEDLSLPWRPYHRHDALEPLEPGQTYALDIEIWPTSVIIPAGYRLGLTIRGCDYTYEGPVAATSLSHFGKSKMTGVGIYTHKDRQARPRKLYGGTTTLVAGPDQQSWLLLPLIPSVE